MNLTRLVAFWIAVLAAVVVAVVLLREVLLPFVAGMLLAYLLDPLATRLERLGRWGCIYNELCFTRGPLRRLPALLNILRGDMSLIGPRPVAPGDLSTAERSAWRRFNVRPGLICLWWIRQRANIAYGS